MRVKSRRNARLPIECLKRSRRDMPKHDPLDKTSRKKGSRVRAYKSTPESDLEMKKLIDRIEAKRWGHKIREEK